MIKTTLDRTTKIIDSSKLNDFLDCPRKFYYSHIKGWKRDAENHHLRFGTAWHRGGEVLFNKGNDAWEEAYAAFCDSYSEYLEIGGEIDEAMAPKNSIGAYQAYIGYASRYAKDEFEIIRHKGKPLVEVYGSVPIDKQLSLFYRIDGIVRNKQTGKIWAMERKTTSNGFRPQWAMQWSLAIQISAYYHVLFSTFPEEEVGGVMIDAVSFSKKTIDFLRLPIQRTIETLEAWRTDVSYWGKSIRSNLNLLKKEMILEAPSHMTSFPKNPQSCTKYFGCTYHDLCCAWSNPLDKDYLPAGFQVSFWDPRKEN